MTSEQRQHIRRSIDRMVREEAKDERLFVYGDLITQHQATPDRIARRLVGRHVDYVQRADLPGKESYRALRAVARGFRVQLGRHG